MSLKQVKARIKALRYNYWISRLLRLTFYPVMGAGKLSSRMKSHLKVNGGIIKYDGVKLRFPPGIGVNTATRIFWDGAKGFETHVWKVMKALVMSRSAFFDIGSNFGFYSVLVNKVKPGISTFAFEPLPHLYDCNVRFHRANAIDSKSVIVNEAVSDRSGSTTILFPRKRFLRNEVTSASMDNAFFTHKGFEKEEITITSSTLDDFAMRFERQAKITNPVLKIDVEGHEFAVLKGGEAFFKKHRPPAIIEIFLAPENLDNIIAWTGRMDYMLYAISPVGLIRVPPEQLYQHEGDRNFLLVAAEKVDRKDLTVIPYSKLSVYFQTTA